MTKVWPRNLFQDDARAFFRLRIAFGLLGILLPLLLALTGLIADGQVQPSISDFFHTTQRDLLVGGLCAIGMFLAVHRGWQSYPGRWISPDLIAVIAGVAAIGVAFFPNESDTISTFSQQTLGLKLSPAFHYASASMLYLMMSLTCFLVYAPDAQTWERRFYLVMGAIVWTTGWNVMILSGIKNSGDGWLAQFIETQNLVYWDESIGVWAFSISWILKAFRERARSQHSHSLRNNRISAEGAITSPAGKSPSPKPTGTEFVGRLKNAIGTRTASAPTSGLSAPVPIARPNQRPITASDARYRRTCPPPAQGRKAQGIGQNRRAS